jgi:hypothetical protein
MWTEENFGKNTIGDYFWKAYKELGVSNLERVTVND